MTPGSIEAINQLPDEEKREIYARINPTKLLRRFEISGSLESSDGQDLASFRFASGATDCAIKLYHGVGAEDPLFYAHLTHGQIHALL